MEISPGVFTAVKLKLPIFSTAMAILSGLAVLVLFFFPISFAGVDWRAELLRWAVSLSAVALLVGLMNLASVHSRKLDNEGAFPVNSLVLILAMLISFFLVLIFGPTSPGAMFILNYIQIPVETSLIAILAITLVYSSARLVRRKTDTFSFVFLATALVILVTTSPLVTDLFPIIGDRLFDLRIWVTTVPATAGARGILIGIALGTIATGIRILMGADRPYGGG